VGSTNLDVAEAYQADVIASAVFVPSASSSGARQSARLRPYVARRLKPFGNIVLPVSSTRWKFNIVAHLHPALRAIISYIEIFEARASVFG
jgi:hypothetical protein